MTYRALIAAAALVAMVASLSACVSTSDTGFVQTPADSDNPVNDTDIANGSPPDHYSHGHIK